MTAVWWLLRAVEVTGLCMASVVRRTHARKLELRLGATKSDIEGRASRRLLSCICASSLPPRMCPYHMLSEHVLEREAAGAKPTDPLFISVAGAKPSEEGTVKAWRLVVPTDLMRSDLGEVSTKLISGHTPRRLGAQWYARLGVQKWLIMYLSLIHI